MRVGLILGEVANGLRRNVSMVISVVLVTFISLTFVGAAVIFSSALYISHREAVRRAKVKSTPSQPSP